MLDERKSSTYKLALLRVPGVINPNRFPCWSFTRRIDSAILPPATTSTPPTPCPGTGTSLTYDTTASKHRGSSLDALFTQVETAWPVIASAG